jgi:hypothetical protein
MLNIPAYEKDKCSQPILTYYFNPLKVDKEAEKFSSSYDAMCSRV